MNLQERLDLLERLGKYVVSNDEEWAAIKEKAYYENAWFIPQFIELASKNIAENFLEKEKLNAWIKSYDLQENVSIKNVGVVMAGNIPLVGFQDFLCVFISGNKITMKPSSKDFVLIKHLTEKIIEWNDEAQTLIAFADNLKGCDAYIATGSNNSGRYFQYYFGKYPNIIRRNRTSAAVISGSETKEELGLLADDMQLYFGLGCRNVTKLYVPGNYDFIPLLTALKKYDDYLDFHKYKHNFDYQLALLIMNNKLYLNSGAVIFSENENLFSPISQVFYEYYNDVEGVKALLQNNKDVQCIIGKAFVPFGKSQTPLLNDFADGVDVIQFLKGLN